MKPTTLASRITALSLIEILEHDRAASDRLLPRRWIARLRPPHHDDKTTPHSVCRPGESPPRTAPTCRALVTSIADAIRLHRGIPPWPGFAIAVSRDSIIKSFLEYNLRMSLRGNGFSRSVQSLDIRLVVDRIPAFTWSARADCAVEFVNQRCNPHWIYVCAISTIVLPQPRGQA